MLRNPPIHNTGGNLHTIRSQRGVALLVTLAAVSVMLVAAFELHRNVTDIVEHTDALRNRVRLRHMAASGVHGAMALLVKDRMETPNDSIQEMWADEQAVSELLESMPFEEGRLALRITDERARIQINALVRLPDRNAPNDAQMFFLERFLSDFMEADSDDDDASPRAVVNSIKDWIDAGDDDAISGLTGAESEYYRSLDSPYAIRNGPIPFRGELLRIKGITPELYHGTPEAPGISAYVTSHGLVSADGKPSFPGRVNIGTAELPVLQAMLPEGLEALAEQIHDHRSEKTGDRYVNDITDPSWYTRVPGFSILAGDDLKAFQDLVTTASDLFRIESTAELRGAQLVAEAVVERIQDRETGKWKCKILQWQTAE